MTTAQALNKRPSELEDGRRWSCDGWGGLQHEFAFVVYTFRIDPSELDVLELGIRAARYFAEEIATQVEKGVFREYRIVHPVEKVDAWEEET